MSAVLLALLIGFAEALLTNTDWRVGLSIGDRVPSSRGRLLPLSAAVALRFAGDATLQYVWTGSCIRLQVWDVEPVCPIIPDSSQQQHGALGLRLPEQQQVRFGQ